MLTLRPSVALLLRLAVGATAAFIVVNGVGATASAQQLAPTWLEGTIGGQKVRMYLESTASDEAAVFGLYYYEKYGEPIVLTSLEAAPGSLVFGECYPCDTQPKANRLVLTLGGTDAPLVQGTWTSEDEQRTLPVRLKRVAEFVTSIPVGNLRRFRDQRWPIEFMYPAGWLVSVTASELAVLPPDPEDMVWRNELRCEQGRGLPAPPLLGEPPVVFDSPFVRTPFGWRVTSSPWGDDLEEPKVRGDVMSGLTGSRHGARWPLPGIFEETKHLVVSGETWVLCTDRLGLDDEKMNLRLVKRR